MSSSDVFLCSLGDLPDDAALRVEPEGIESLSVVRLGDEVFAVSDKCSHGDASLAEGFVEDGLVFCPFHSGSFDVRTGEAVGPPCFEPVRTYPVEIRGGDVFLLPPDLAAESERSES